MRDLPREKFKNQRNRTSGCSTQSTEAFLRLVKTQFEHPGTGPGKGKFSWCLNLQDAAVKAIPEMYNLHVANMRNKYSNERQKLARMYV